MLQSHTTSPSYAGRYWGSANRAELTEHPEGDATISLRWDDGAHVTFCEDTHQAARQTLVRLGFTVTRA